MRPLSAHSLSHENNKEREQHQAVPRQEKGCLARVVIVRVAIGGQTFVEATVFVFHIDVRLVAEVIARRLAGVLGG